MKKLFTLILTLFAMLAFAVISFAADGEIRYSNELTSSPLRIFFAVLAVVLFVLLEIGVEKIRNKKVAKRNKEDK